MTALALSESFRSPVADWVTPAPRTATKATSAMPIISAAAAAAAALRDVRALAQRDHRRDARGARRRADAREHGHDDPDQSGDHDRAQGQAHRGLRQVEAEGLEDPVEAVRQPEAGEDSDDR